MHPSEPLVSSRNQACHNRVTDLGDATLGNKLVLAQDCLPSEPSIRIKS